MKPLVALLLYMAPALAAPAGKTDVFTFPTVEKTLPNGLKVVVVQTGFPNIVSLQIPVQTGSRNEVEPGKSGFAHFFEHMMFRGTKAYPPDAYQAILTRLGARQNAYTTNDYTNYHTTFSKDDLETMLKIEADRFQNLSYAEAAFKTEARAVLGEYNKNASNPVRKLDEVMRDHAYAKHTYKHTTMGFLKDIEDMPNQYAYSLEFFKRWYRPEYTTVIVAGDVKPAETIKLVEKYFAGWKRGTFKAQIPAEPPATKPVYAHVDWPSPTLPWVTVGFHAPPFSATSKEYVALDALFDLTFGETSELYQRLVVETQKVDRLQADSGGSQDPGLATVFARVKKPEDAAWVRDQIMAAFSRATTEPVQPERLAQAKANARYAFVRRLDNTEAIAATLAAYVRYARDPKIINALFRTHDALTAADLQAVAKEYFTDAQMVVTTLARGALAPEVASLPALESLRPKTGESNLALTQQKTALPQITFKLSFQTGSAHDPKGKEGLAGLTAALVTGGGSQRMRIEEIEKALYPMAGVFRALTDKEVTTFTGRIHKDNWRAFLDVVLPQLVEPGFRPEDFQRIRDLRLNQLEQDLRANNEEELGKERLQWLIHAGTPYAHPPLGTAAGLKAITLDDVKQHARAMFTRARLEVGVAGDAPAEMVAALERAISRLPAGEKPAAPAAIAARSSRGLTVEIVDKDTRATAISLGHPIEVTRSHPDFAALWLARSWLGEHRSSSARLFQRIREVRGMNYGDYAYIEAFPRGGFQFFPEPGIPRRAQIFEIWIRPVAPQNAEMALKIALHELEKLVESGLSAKEFEATREYLMKNVFVMTATQEQQIGYALDSKWHGIGEFTAHMRKQLEKLTVEDVSRALKRHLHPKDMWVVMVAKDGKALKDRLLKDAPSAIVYESEKPKALLDEDKLIGARRLEIAPAQLTITPVDQVFAR
jgi:zinc protease